MNRSVWWKLIAIAFLCSCTTTRTIATLDDVRLRSGDHSDGFAVNTTGDFRSRIDANSKLVLRAKDGTQTHPVIARDVATDAKGVWMPSEPVWISYAVDTVEIDATSEVFGTLLAATKPAGAELVRHDRLRWTLAGGQAVVGPWLRDLDERILGSESVWLHASLPRITATNAQGLRRSLNNSRFEDFMRLEATARFGWTWDDIANIEVTNYSAGKTFAASFVVAAAAIVVAPIAALGSGGGRFGSRGSNANVGSSLNSAIKLAAAVATASDGPTEDSFVSTLAPAPVASTSRMFTTAARTHGIIRGTLSLDGGASFAGDHIATGLIARMRLGEMFEIGGGAREVLTRDEMGWKRSTTAVLGLGWHLPLDAEYKFAIPVGFEGSWGGEVAHDVRFPIGLRYTRGRFFGTVYPATPQHMRVDTQKHGRWSYASTLEIGTSF